MCMEKIAILTVYYGNFPPYFDLWLRSCEFNETIDFYIVTDNDIDKLPENVKIINITLEGFCVLAEKKLHKKVRIDTPYKLCDFKPIYGHILEDYLSEYDYWGHCDVDLIFGDLRKFFNLYKINKYDRFLHLGHLSLYKNTPECKEYYKLDGAPCGSWEEVVTNPQNFLFDEWNGVYGIYHKHNISMFEERIFADISMIYKRFRLALNDKNYDQQVFYWENGHVYRKYWIEERPFKQEFLYIHFKKRKFTKETFDASTTTSFYIGPDGFTEKNKSATIEDVKRINPYYGEKYELKELHHMEWEEKKAWWKKRITELWGRK